MYKETYELLAIQEDTYWWNSVRRMMCRELLARHGVSSGGRWLDLGSGTGGNFVLAESFQPSEIVGLDISPTALSISRRKCPHIRTVEGDLKKPLPFSDNHFDVVTVFNVLYHDWVSDESAVVREIARVLKPGGTLVITEPAFKCLFRRMDVCCMGSRRYRISDIQGWCRAAGLRITRSSYFSSFGFPLILAEKFLHKLMSRRADEVPPGLKEGNRLFNSILGVLAKIETFLLVRGLTFPIGTTVITVARK